MKTLATLILAVSVAAPLSGCGFPDYRFDHSSGAGGSGSSGHHHHAASSSSGSGGSGGGDPAGYPPGDCSDAGMQACAALWDACTPDSECYAFKACYEDVQTDQAAIQACVDGNPDGAAEWKALVACGCGCWADQMGLFCDPAYAPWGHPNG